jgi:FAD:protein FMN transferase
MEVVVSAFPALGTTASVVTDRSAIDPAVASVRTALAEFDETCSRFREDSDLSRLNRAGGGWTQVSDVFVEAVSLALRAARLTGGIVDPTIGEAMLRLGYDRDFARMLRSGPPAPPPPWLRSDDWRRVEIRADRRQVRLPRGVKLDLGSTAKALAADRAVAAAAGAVGRGVLVSLGGDVAVSGDPPDEGWSVGLADDHAGTPEPGETIVIVGGGVATSSTTVRRWIRGDATLHHIIDPRTGAPAREVWRTVSVCAASCADANIASTAGIILGDDAPAWLARHGMPARLVRPDGSIVRVAGWPERTAA